MELASRDSLTVLHNRHRFKRDVADQVQGARSYGEVAVLTMIDLNGFKKINDVHGHRMGDKVLKAVATALRERLRDTDMVVRIGGDEFAVIMPYARFDTAKVIADGLQKVIKECVDDLGVPGVRLSASIGQLEINADSEGEESVIGEVVRLMYLEKKKDPTREDRN